MENLIVSQWTGQELCVNLNITQQITGGLPDDCFNNFPIERLENLTDTTHDLIENSKTCLAFSSLCPDDFKVSDGFVLSLVTFLVLNYR